ARAVRRERDEEGAVVGVRAVDRDLDVARCTAPTLAATAVARVDAPDEDHDQKTEDQIDEDRGLTARLFQHEGLGRLYGRLGILATEGSRYKLRAPSRTPPNDPDSACQDCLARVNRRVITPHSHTVGCDPRCAPLALSLPRSPQRVYARNHHALRLGLR